MSFSLMQSSEDSEFELLGLIVPLVFDDDRSDLVVDVAVIYNVEDLIEVLGHAGFCRLHGIHRVFVKTQEVFVIRALWQV